MPIRSRIILVVLSVAFVCLARGQPNVLFIVCDDLNTHVSSSGYAAIETPNFDRLAAKGMTFDRAYCQYPVCGPSRASFLHGLYPEVTGVLSNTLDIRDTRPGTVSLPQAFKEQGYWTAATGKVFHNVKMDHGTVAWNEMERFSNDELPIAAAARVAFEAEHGPVTSRDNRSRWKRISKRFPPRRVGRSDRVTVDRDSPMISRRTVKMPFRPPRGWMVRRMVRNRFSRRWGFTNRMCRSWRPMRTSISIRRAN